jgi:acetyl-CoA carboxylase alpha subunit
MMPAKWQDAAAKEHRRKYRIDGVRAQTRLANALVILDENQEALQLALRRLFGDADRFTPEAFRAALRLLVNGEKYCRPHSVLLTRLEPGKTTG